MTATTPVPIEVELSVVSGLIRDELARALAAAATEVAEALVEYTRKDLRGHNGSAQLGRTVLRELVELVLLLDLPEPLLGELDQ